MKYRTYYLEANYTKNTWSILKDVDCKYMILCKDDLIIRGFIRFLNQRHCETTRVSHFHFCSVFQPTRKSDNHFRSSMIVHKIFFEKGLSAKQGTRLSSDMDAHLQGDVYLQKELEEKNKIIEELQRTHLDQQAEFINELKTDKDQYRQIIDILYAKAKETPILVSQINNNNNIKQKFNLNFFLNEQCKDAMNILDFVRNIKLELGDMLLHGEIGYVNAISQIMNTELKKMDLTKRPIHCTDIKRETIYVRNESKWNNDGAPELLEKAIDLLSNRNHKQMNIWKEQNPDFRESEEKSNKYLLLTQNLMGGSSDHEQSNNAKKIIKNLLHICAIKSPN